jgi:uncharacterized protein YdaU (DUF1376 family)
MSIPFMQVYVADYTADTQHLSCEEDGAYWRLLRSMWRSGGCLPLNDRKLAIICGLSGSAWRRVWPSIEPFFEVSGETITQKRLAKELVKASEKSEKRRSAGKLGGEAKSLKYKEPALANADDLLCHSLEPEPEVEDNRVPDGTLVPFADETKLAFDAYNEMAKRVKTPTARNLDPDRKKRLAGRLKEAGGLDGWFGVITKIAESPFLTGQTSDFTVTLDWAIKPANFRKIIEGNYDGRSPNGTRPADAARGRKLDNLREGALAFVNDGGRWGIGDPADRHEPDLA